MTYQRITQVALAVLLGTVHLAAQQVDGRIRGLVLDSSGAVVGDAEVEVRRIETGATRFATSGANGRYTVPALSPGSYSISVSAKGFRPVSNEPIQLSLGGEAEASFVLQVGPASDAITVSGESSALAASQAAIGNVIPNRFIVSLPLNGRNFLHLSLLVPGAVPAAVGSPGSERGRFAFQTNGARESANSFLYDGVYAIDPILNSFSFAPPVDAVREFRIQT
ncbi:MAG: carboxypeptidase-like regulatory domain-containing protein, partial [Bryobacterales bacterium]|nr:carboxypeptidase-like regulatory domain-containing protein [Bryobacterales bacterium]